jgi:hypothetical protein
MVPINLLVQGGLGIASGIVGSQQRAREQEQARTQYEAALRQYRQQDLSNPYQNMENVYEDLTVNLQAADYQREQQAQGLSNIMAQTQAAAGGSGIASLAQALANQQAQGAQQLSAQIGTQEAQNIAAERQMAGQLQGMEREGEMISRGLKREQYSTELGMGQQRLAAANMARQQATQALMGGIGSAVVGGVGYKAEQDQGNISWMDFLLGTTDYGGVENE